MSLPGRPKGEYRSAQHEGTPISDDAIYAFTPPPAAGSAPPPRVARRRLWPWLLVGLALLLAVMVVATALAFNGLLHGVQEGLSINVDGQPWTLHHDSDWGFFGVLGLLAAVMTLLLILPVILMGVMLAVALTVGLALLAVVAAVALVAAVVLLAAAVVLSPLWGALLLLWLLLRPKRQGATQAG